MDNFELDGIFEDDLDVLEIIDVGVPRHVYVREDKFNSLDDLSFYKRFRLTKQTTLDVLALIENRIEFPYDINQSVSPINQLLIVLRYYATGSYLLVVGDFSCVHESTASRIIKRVSEAIAELAPIKIRFPIEEAEVQQAQQEFFNVAAFPRVLGALDCTHIKIQRPSKYRMNKHNVNTVADVGVRKWFEEIYRNRKQFFSINVQAVSSASMKFVNIVARWPGSSHDATIFNNSNLRLQYEMGRYPNTLLLGDSAYPNRLYLMTPLLNPITRAEGLYNQAQIRTRGTVEKLFGIWKRRFPVLAYGCRLRLNTTLTVIVATAVLHNIARDMGEGEVPTDDELGDGRINLNELIQQGNIFPGPHALQYLVEHIFDVRRNLIDNYFNNLQ